VPPVARQSDGHCGMETEKAGEMTSLWVNMRRERFESLEDFWAGSLGPRRADGAAAESEAAKLT
jgi:hypothetical protein